MSRPTSPPRPARAQGNIRLRWPDGIVDEPDNCCVALRVRVTDAELAPREDLPRIAWGPALPTLRELIAYRFDGKARAVLEHEIQAFGWIDPTCPLRIERLTQSNNPQTEQPQQWHVFLEALVLPFGEKQAAELGALMRREPDPAARHWRGWEYARELEGRWEQHGQIPRAFLDVNFRVTRAQDIAAASGPDELLPAERELLPLGT